MKDLALFLGLATVACAPAAVGGVNWPQFRGPNASGVAEAEKPPLHFNAASNVIWKTSLPPGHSSPCLWQDRIFLTGYADGKLETICVQRRDGKVLWRQAVSADNLELYHDRDGSPAASTPATDGQRVYVYFGSVGLICYDLAGREQWRHALSLPETSGFGTGTSPIVADGLVVLNRDQNTNARLLAVEGRTGKLAWEVPRPDSIVSFSTPILWPHDGVKEVVLPGFLRVKGYNLQDGSERWLAQGLPAAVCTTPVLGEGLCFVAAWSNGTAENPFPIFDAIAAQVDRDKNGELSREEMVGAGMKDMFVAADLNKDGKITREEWDAIRTMVARGRNVLLAIRPGGAGDVSETHVAWRATKGLPYVSSPLYYRGRIFLVRDGGIASCYEAKTGKMLFEQERLGTGGSYFASPVAASGRIYVASNSGVITVLNAGDALEVQAKNDLGEKIYATPAIADDRLYVRTPSRLFAFGAQP